MRGLFASVIAVVVLSSGVTAHQPRPNFPANDTVYITKTGAKYHKVTCRTLKKSKEKTALKRSEAESKGYQACKVCHP